MNTLVNNAPMKRSVVKVMFIALIKLPLIVHVYGAGMSLGIVFLSEDVLMKVLGVAGSAITAILAGIRAWRDYKNDRKLQRAEQKLLLLEAENAELNARNKAFEAERANFRASVEERLRNMETKLP